MSKNYDKVLYYYEKGLWNLAKVYSAVGKWITADEYKMITGEDYE